MKLKYLSFNYEPLNVKGWRYTIHNEGKAEELKIHPGPLIEGCLLAGWISKEQPD